MTEFSQYHAYVLIVAALPVIYAAARDLREFRIPNECSLALLALFPVHVLIAPNGVDVASSLLAAGGVFAVTYTIHAFDRLGGGDVKLMSALALWAGPALLADFVVVTTLSGAALAIIFMSPARHALALVLDHAGDGAARDNVLAERLPYGVAIAVGGLVTLSRLAG